MPLFSARLRKGIHTSHKTAPTSQLVLLFLFGGLLNPNWSFKILTTSFLMTDLDL